MELSLCKTCNQLIILFSIVLSKSSIRRLYLVEELIDEQRDGFHKFINNGSAIPLPPPNDETLLTLADILSFTQHVQFYETRGMVYLSDLHDTVYVYAVLSMYWPKYKPISLQKQKLTITYTQCIDSGVKI
jgi:hypothetical protein